MDYFFYCMVFVPLEHNQELLDLLEDSGVDPTKPSDSYNIFKTPLNAPGSSPGTSSRILNLLKQSRNILKDPELIEAVPEHPQGSIE